MNKTWHPLHDFVLLEEEPVVPYHEHKGYTKIIVPEKWSHGPEDRPVIGRVIQKGRRCLEPSIRRGSRVVIGKWAAARIPQDGTVILLVKEDDIMAVIQ